MTELELNSKDFVGPNGISTSYYNISLTNVWPGHEGDRWVQYKGTLHSNNYDETPILRNVTITHNYWPNTTLISPVNKSILNNKEILIDGRRRKESKFLAGLMDTVSIPSTAEQFRILIDKKGRLTVVPIVKEEAGVKLCKIVKKGMVKGKVQLGLHDGRSIIVEKDGYKTGDSLLITVPDQTIKEHLKLEKGVLVYLIGGKYIGNIGTIDKLEKGGIIAKIGAENVEVKKEYIFVVGKGKAAISLK